MQGWFHSDEEHVVECAGRRAARRQRLYTFGLFVLRSGGHENYAQSGQQNRDCTQPYCANSFCVNAWPVSL
jgi:hypothetical protein